MWWVERGRGGVFGGLRALCEDGFDFFFFFFFFKDRERGLGLSRAVGVCPGDSFPGEV